MAHESHERQVIDLQRDGILLVEDGNHGENRPRREEFSDEGTAFIRAADMDDGRVMFDTASRINSVALARIRKGIGAAGDVLLSHKGTVGKVALVPRDCPPFVCSPQTTFWRSLDPDRLDRKYLYAYMRSQHFHQQLKSRQDETDMAAYVSLTAQRELRILLPEINTQRNIAEVIGSLDEKIDVNYRANRVLEAMARAVFKAWFVDFDPVKAKAAGAASFPGMTQEVFDSLPETLVDSELGEIPEGWEVKALGDVFEVIMGQSPPSEFYNEEGVGLPFHQGVRDYGYRFPVDRVYCTLEARIAEPRDVLLSVRAPVGRINVATRRMVIGRGLAAVRHPEGFQSYTLYSLKHLFAVEDEVGDGTIYKAVTKKFLLGMPIVCPPDPLVSEVETLLRPMDALLGNGDIEARVLAYTRDALLPKLISGEIVAPTAIGGGNGG